MSQPQKPPHATMFLTADQTTAVLVEHDRATAHEFAAPELALAWCRARGVCFVWLPVPADPESLQFAA